METRETLEKSVLQCESFSQSNCAVAVCGSNFNKFQLNLLLKECNPKEIIICFDKEENKGEEKYFNKLWNLCKKYINYCNFSFIYDREELLDMKDSPSDKGEKVFNKLKQYGNKGYVIRKIAHFTIYAAIGISISLFLYVITKKIFISSTLAFILSYMYAYYDELTRQVSVVGRTGTIKDVIIDSAGAFTGIAILFMIVVTFNGIRGFIRFVFRESEA